MFKIYILLLVLTIVYGLPVHKRSFGNVAGNVERPQMDAVNSVWPDVFPRANQLTIPGLDIGALPDLIVGQQPPNVLLTGPNQNALYHDLLVTTVDQMGDLRYPDNALVKDLEGNN